MNKIQIVNKGYTKLTPSSSRGLVSPFLILALGVLAVSTSSIFIRMAQRDAPSLSVAAYRLGFASLVLIPFVWKRREELRALRPSQWGLLAVSGGFLAVHFAVWVTSLAYTTVASSVVFVTTTPLWVGLLSPVILRERLEARLWAGMGIALFGGILVALNSTCTLSRMGLACSNLEDFYQGRAFYGNLLALAGAWMAAGYMIIGRKIRPMLSLTGYIGSVYPFAAVFLFLIALAGGTQLTGFNAETYLWFGALALVPQLLGHTSYNYALGYLPAAFVSVSVLGEPIGSSLLAILVLGEFPSAIEILGGVIILAGIGLASYKK